MKILLLILSVVVFVILLLLLAVYFSRLYTRKSKSTYFYLKIKILAKKFEIANDKNKFDEYPLIKEQIEKFIKLIENEQEFDVRKIKISKQKIRNIVNNDTFDKIKVLTKEYDTALKKDSEIIKIIKEVSDIKVEIIKYRFPIRSVFDKYIFMFKLRILLLIVKVMLIFINYRENDTLQSKRFKNKLNEFENNEEIIDKYKNEDNSGFSFPGELRING